MATILCALTIGLLAFYHNDVFFIRHIEIVIENPTETDSKLVKLWTQKIEQKLDYLSGKALFTTPIEKIRSDVEAEDWVISGSVRKSFPDTIVVQIISEKVAAAMVGEKGLMAPVSEKGKILKAVESGEVPDVPILVGEGLRKSSVLRQSAILMFHELPSEGRMGRARIAEIGYEEQHGFWTRTMDQKAKIFLGREDFQLRAHRVSQVLQYLDQRQIEARVIDAGLSKKVLVRLRKDP
jgi:cell division protein FtsQ